MTFHSKYVNDCRNTGEHQAFCAHSMFTETSGAPAPRSAPYYGRKSHQLPKETNVNEDREPSPSPTVFAPTWAHVLTTHEF